MRLCRRRVSQTEGTVRTKVPEVRIYPVCEVASRAREKSEISVYTNVLYVCMHVCVYLCSVWDVRREAAVKKGCSGVPPLPLNSISCPESDPILFPPIKPERI